MGKAIKETAAVRYGRKESEEKYIETRIAEALKLDEQIKKIACETGCY